MSLQRATDGGKYRSHDTERRQPPRSLLRIPDQVVTLAPISALPEIAQFPFEDRARSSLRCREVETIAPFDGFIQETDVQPVCPCVSCHVENVDAGLISCEATGIGNVAEDGSSLKGAGRLSRFGGPADREG